MHSYWFVVLVCVITPALSHTYLSSVTVNGNKETSCLRPFTSNNPISSVNSNDMICGFLPKASQPAASKCGIAAGSKIGLQWNHNSPAADDDIVDPSHKGPCMVYLSRDNGATWFKIFESGYDAAKQEFCVTTLIANRGYMEVTIPNDIAPGDYLMRGEIIALHEGNKLNGAQPYVACAELTVSGSGTATPAGVVFPGAYSPQDPGILFDLYAQPMKTYVVPGPAVYGSGSTGPSSNGNGVGSSNAGKSGGGMSAGGAAALSIFMILLAVGAVVGLSIFIYRRNGHLFGYALHRIDSKSYVSSATATAAPTATSAPPPLPPRPHGVTFTATQDLHV